MFLGLPKISVVAFLIVLIGMLVNGITESWISGLVTLLASLVFIGSLKRSIRMSDNELSAHEEKEDEQKIPSQKVRIAIAAPALFILLALWIAYAYMRTNSIMFVIGSTALAIITIAIFVVREQRKYKNQN